MPIIPQRRNKDADGQSRKGREVIQIDHQDAPFARQNIRNRRIVFNINSTRRPHRSRGAGCPEVTGHLNIQNTYTTAMVNPAAWQQVISLRPTRNSTSEKSSDESRMHQGAGLCQVEDADNSRTGI
ncbi:hypothetical protein QCN27_17405 [Cereibacter sp. SYSU M97828]|nr:hypothetical protein [Cereibacter flavus]